MRPVIARIRAAEGDEGFTLIEVLVVTLILGVVGSITVAGLVAGMDSSAHRQARVDALTDTQTAVERISRELRGADPLRHAEPDAVHLDVWRSPDTMIHYRLFVEQAADGGWQLRQQRWHFDDPSIYGDRTFEPTRDAAARTDERVVVDQLTADSRFEFLDSDGGSLADASAGAAADHARKVRLVFSRIVEEDSPPIEVETTVQLRNPGGL